jgi:hypothetical protein
MANCYLNRWRVESRLQHHDSRFSSEPSHQDQLDKGCWCSERLDLPLRQLARNRHGAPARHARCVSGWELNLSESGMVTWIPPPRVCAELSDTMSQWEIRHARSRVSESSKSMAGIDLQQLLRAWPRRLVASLPMPLWSHAAQELVQSLTATILTTDDDNRQTPRLL